jgi:hypothetical protein
MLLNVKDFNHDASTWKLATTSTRRTLGNIFELYVVVIDLADFGGVCLVPIGAVGQLSTMLVLKGNRSWRIIVVENAVFYGKLMTSLQKLYKKILTC